MNVNRRNCLKLTGGSIAGFYSIAMLGGCESILENIKNRPVRRNIQTLSNNDPIIQAYRDGVAAMKALPNSDRRNWNRQASIHADFCPHSNWYFLPWHRAYIYYFETIIRELSGYEEFTLPYWNWTCQPTIPAPFFDIPDLVDPTRSRGPGDTIPTSITGEPVLHNILGIPDFETFGSFESTALRGGSGGGTGELEGAPHNSVHVWVGGNMRSVPVAARDPIFWCHHNMIERCWWDWNITQGKTNPESSRWTGLSLAGMFCDKDGNLVDNLTVGYTALFPALLYQFDDQLLPCSRPEISGLAGSKLRGKELRKFLEQGGPARLSVKERLSVSLPNAIMVSGSEPRKISLPKETTQLLLNKQRASERVVLRINSAKLDQDQDVFVRLFINLQDDSNLKRAEGMHYAGSFAFFGGGEHHRSMGTGNTFHIDITNTVEELLRAGAISTDTPLNVTLIPVSIADGKPTPRGKVEISGIEVLFSEGFE